MAGHRSRSLLALGQPSAELGGTTAADSAVRALARSKMASAGGMSARELCGGDGMAQAAIQFSTVRRSSSTTSRAAAPGSKMSRLAAANRMSLRISAASPGESARVLIVRRSGRSGNCPLPANRHAGFAQHGLQGISIVGTSAGLS